MSDPFRKHRGTHRMRAAISVGLIGSTYVAFIDGVAGAVLAIIVNLLWVWEG